jgi:cell division septation protein DedD
MSVRRLLVLPALSALLLLGACGELQDWRGTQRADTLEAYQSFLDRHPQSQYAPVAQRRLADLEEQRDWLIATESDSAEGYRTFINTHPKGRWTREARLRLQNFLSTPGVIGPAAIEPVEPLPPPAMLPATPAIAIGDSDAASPPADPSAAVSIEPAPVTHRIQLGAFSSRDKALEAWREARAAQAQLQGLVSQVIVGSNGQVEIYRLQASVVSEERAREICRVLTAAGQGCVYVPPGR